MPRKRYSTEQIVTKLRPAEVELGRGLRTPEMCKERGGSEQTSYRWRKEYGGLRLDQAKWTVWLSADYRAAAWRELARESQARGAAVAAGRAEGAPETAEARATVAG